MGDVLRNLGEIGCLSHRIGVTAGKSGETPVSTFLRLHGEDQPSHPSLPLSSKLRPGNGLLGLRPVRI